MSSFNQYGFIPPFLNPFIGDSGEGGTEGLVPAPVVGDGSDGKFLGANGEWAIPSGTGGGVTGVGSFDSQTPASNALTIIGTNLYAQSASETNPGMMNTGAQTFSGLKIFTAAMTVMASLTLTPNTNQLVFGETNTTTMTMASLTAPRTFTLPDADSNPIRPLGSATANQFVQYIGADGVQHLAQVSATGLSGIVPIANGGTNLNALGTANQFLGVTAAGTALEYKSFAVGTSGTDFDVAYTAGTVTFNLPNAGAAARGVVSTSSQTFAGAKTLSSALAITPNTNQLVLGTTNTTTYSMASLSASRTFTTPDANSNSVRPLGSATANNWVQYISSDGTQNLAQPAFTNISGIAASAQLPNPTTSAIGGVQAVNAVSNQWINSINTSGVPQLSQPAFSNISGQASLTTQVTGTLPFGNGGTGQTSYTDGQLLIGNTATGGISKATLTQGSNITITNGNGTITIAATTGAGGVSALNGTPNQIATNANTGVVTVSLPNGISLGSLGATTPPSGGGLFPGLMRFGTSTAPTATTAVTASIASTFSANYVLSGNSFDASSDTDGIALALYHNATNNRQLIIGDSAKLASSGSNFTIRVLPAVPSIDGLATNGTAIQLTLGNSAGTYHAGNSGFGSANFAAAQRIEVRGSILTQNDGSAAYEAYFRSSSGNDGVIIQTGGVYSKSDVFATRSLTLGSYSSSAPLPVLTLDSSGFIITSHVAATSGATLKNSYPIFFQGGYWNGSADTGFSYNIRTVLDSTAPAAHLSFQNNNGYEFLWAEMPTTGISSRVLLRGYGQNTNVPYFAAQGSRGTPSSPTATQSGDNLGAFIFSGYQTSSGDFVGSTGIIGQATENFTSSAAGTQVLITAAANGGNVGLTRLLVNYAYTQVIASQLQQAQGTAITSSAFIEAFNGNVFTVSATNSIQCCNGNNFDGTEIPDGTSITMRFLSAGCSIIQGGSVIATGLVFNMNGGVTYVSTANGMITFMKQNISGTKKWLEQYRSA